MGLDEKFDLEIAIRNQHFLARGAESGYSRSCLRTHTHMNIQNNEGELSGSSLHIHEIRTLLTPLLFQARILRKLVDQAELTPSDLELLRQTARKSEAQLQRASLIVHKLLDALKADSLN